MRATSNQTPHRDSIASPHGNSEMEKRIQAFDWSQTPVGPLTDWPQSLKTAVRILLNSRYPMFIWWGPELINLYNDAYISVLGARHPQALGQPASQIWSDIWPVVGPQSQIVLEQGQATWNESLLLMMDRYGYSEETYFTFSYSPAPNDDGSVGGVFCVCTEDTQRVVGERQLALLRDLAARTTDTRTWPEACARSAAALSLNNHDLPFAMIYVTENDGVTYTLAGASGITPGHAAAPFTINLDEQGIWPLAMVLSSNDVVVVENLSALVDDELPTGAWPEPPACAALLPIAATGQTGRGGVLIVGLNPYRFFDDDYRNFLVLIAGQISAGIASAQAYEEEKKRAEALTQLDQTKTTFFSNVSHEFRTPLTLMLGPVEDLLDKNEDQIEPETREQLEVIHRNSLRLLKLVNTMLDFSRIEAGRMQAEYEPTDLAHYTAELASVFRATIEHAGLQLIVNCAPLPEPVYINRDMWEKIVLNLLSNAFKFTLSGEIEVRLDAIADEVQLTIRDTGVGIPESDMPHIFERFHRVQDSRGRTYEGTGIGLALVQELVKLHGGTVYAESVLNEGSRFIVTLPFGYTHLASQHINYAPAPAPAMRSVATFLQESWRWLPNSVTNNDQQTRAPGEGQRDSDRPIADNQPQESLPHILLADDNADMRAYVSRLLSDHFNVEAVTDGQAALEAARANPPDLVLSDVMMPKLDGFGLLRALRADPDLREIPIVLLSARADEEARIEGRAINADDYLIKPFSARELVACVESHVRMARIRRESNKALRASETQYRELSTRLKALLETTSRLIETLETNELLSSLLDLSYEIVPADALGMWRKDENGDWSVIASHGLSEWFIQETISTTASDVPLKTPIVVQPQDWASQETLLLQRRREQYEREGIRSLMVLPLPIAGKISGTLVFYCRSPHVFSDIEIEAAQALANIASAAITTTELYETQSRLRKTAEEAAIRESFLATAGSILSQSLDYEETLSNVAQVAVPDFADWCAVDLLDEEGILRRLATAHVDPQKITLAQELYDKYPPNPEAERGLFHVLRTGVAELVPHLPDSVIVAGAQDEYHLHILRELQLNSYICVPLRIGNNIYGAITFVSAESQQPFDEQDLTTAQEIAHRAAQAIDNARLYRDLSEGEKRLRLALVGARAGVWELDIASGKTHWSSEFETLYGYEAETPHTFEQWLLSIHPDDREQIKEDFARSIETNETEFQREFRIKHPSLGLRWVLDVGRIERDENGRAVRCIGISADITERMQAEMDRRESQERFQLMADAAPVLIWISSPDQLRTWFNEKWLEYVGRSMAEEIGAGWVENLHPEDRDLCLQIYTTAFESRQPFSMEYRLRRYDGEYHWFLDKGVPLYGPNEDFRGYIGSCVDIHDRKLGEAVLLANAARNAFHASLADALRSLADPIALQAEAARILGEYLNATYAFYAEAEPDGEHVLVHRDYHDGVATVAGRYRINDFGLTVAKAFHTGRTLVVDDVAQDASLTEAERRAFTDIGVCAHATVCLVKNGRLAALLGVRQNTPRTWTADEVTLVEEVADRTWAAIERARAETALRQLNETLEDRVNERTRQVRELVSRLTKAEQEERRRISQILHDDLQQLLSAIKTKLHIIRQDLQDVDNPELIEEIEEGYGWLDQAIATTRRLAVDLSPPILQNQGFTNAIEWLQDNMKELHGLDITLEADHEWYVQDENLRVLLFQVVRELLFNVKKHAKVNQAVVRLEEEDGRLVIHVSDDGDGFDVKEVTAREERAAGFGLFSVRGRLQPLNGRLEITSQPGQGTHVAVYTPVPAPAIAGTPSSAEGARE